MLICVCAPTNAMHWHSAYNCALLKRWERGVSTAQQIGTLSTISFEVYIGFSCLSAQILCLQLVFLTILDKMCSALSEFERHVFPDTLRSDPEHPIVVKRSCIRVRFTADNHKFNTVKISFYINGFDKRLSRYTLMLDRKFFKNSEPMVCIFLILNRTANDHVFITVPTIIGDAVHKSVDTLGEKEKDTILALLYHLPAFWAPCIRLLNQKIGGKAGIYNAGFHFVITVL